MITMSEPRTEPEYADVAEEPTPIWDELLAALGDPVIRPPVDRSYATLATRAELLRGVVKQNPGDETVPSASVSLVKPTDSGA